MLETPRPHGGPSGRASGASLAGTSPLTQAWFRLRVSAVSLDFWLGAFCVAVVAFSALQILLFSFGRDQSIYATVADGILHGEMPYRDRWDFKPPGIFVVYAVAQAVFGNTMLAPRLLEVLGLLATCAAMVVMSRRLFLDTRAGMIAAAIGSWVHAQMEFWHSGQPETYGGYLTIAGLLLALYETEAPARRIAQWLACGAAFGFAFLLKPPLGGGALVCAIYMMKQGRGGDTSPLRALQPLFVVALGAAIPLAACALWFWARGAWPDLSWTLFEFTPGYTKLGWGGNPTGAFYYGAETVFTKLSAVIAIGSLAAGVLAPLSGRERQGIALLLGVVALHLAGIAMQAKFFQYHFGATIPLAAMIAGLGWMKIWRISVARAGGGGAVAFFSLLTLTAQARRAVHDVPDGYWARSYERLKFLVGSGDVRSRDELDEKLYFVADFNLSADREVARRVAELTSDEQSIFVWGFEPAIYWFSGRRPASAFIYNVPQRASWGRDRARHRLLEELLESAPEVVVVQHGDFFRFVTGDDLDSAAALPTFPELDQLVQTGYQQVESIEDFDIYRRR